MSKVVNQDLPNDCTLWKAPQLSASEEIDFDFKLNSPESIKHREQQQNIRQQAYEKSYAKGYMEGLAKGKKEITEQVGYLQSLLNSLAMPINGVDDNVVDELAQLSMAVVKQLMKCELKISPDEVIAVIKEALNLLPVTANDISIELHPDDASLVRESSYQTENETKWNVIENSMLIRGDVRVTTSTSRIDASVDNRIRAAITAVMGDEYCMDRSL